MFEPMLTRIKLNHLTAGDAQRLQQCGCPVKGCDGPGVGMQGQDFCFPFSQSRMNERGSVIGASGICLFQFSTTNPIAAALLSRDKRKSRDRLVADTELVVDDRTERAL